MYARSLASKSCTSCCRPELRRAPESQILAVCMSLDASWARIGAGFRHTVGLPDVRAIRRWSVLIACVTVLRMVHASTVSTVAESMARLSSAR